MPTDQSEGIRTGIPIPLLGQVTNIIESYC